MTTSLPASGRPSAAGGGAEAGAGTEVAGGDGVERARAAAVAAVVVRAAVESGVSLDDDLAIWSLAGGRPRDVAPDPRRASSDGRIDRVGGTDVADLLGRVLETATDAGRRRVQGLHVTPAWLADRLVAMAVPPDRVVPGRWPTVCDPACGGGAFLVAAARHLHRLGADRRHVVRDLVWGADIDRVGLAAAEAALALWAGERPPPGRLVLADPLYADVSAWRAAPAGGFGAVVGNPPFLSQLGRATARSASERRWLRRRFGGVVRPYTDTAWLFLLLGCELVRPGGRVVLVEPQSVVAARDAGAVRDAVTRRAVLRDLWLDDDRVFSASVRVCAPVLERRPGTPGPPQPATKDGSTAGGDGDHDHGGTADVWGRLWARAMGLPPVDVGSGPVLGDHAAIIAGFRDQYYGLVEAVREARPGESGATVAPLVTSGAVDWAACTWGDRDVRYAKRRWRAPVVDLARLAAGGPPVAQRWVERTRVPKLVVATQTRVVEAAVDGDGMWVPSVPALAVVPADADELWHVAAAVLSPAATAWLARRAAGTGLERRSLKVAAPALAALPLPPDRDGWDAAAAALAGFVAARRPVALEAYLAAIGRAYGTPGSLTRWWRERAGTVVRIGPLSG